MSHVYKEITRYTLQKEVLTQFCFLSWRFIFGTSLCSVCFCNWLKCKFKWRRCNLWQYYIRNENYMLVVVIPHCSNLLSIRGHDNNTTYTNIDIIHGSGKPTCSFSFTMEPYSFLCWLLQPVQPPPTLPLSTALALPSHGSILVAVNVGEMSSY